MKAGAAYFVHFSVLTKAFLDQTLVSLLGDLSSTYPNLGPCPVFGLPSPVLPRILLSQFSKDAYTLDTSLVKFLIPHLGCVSP